MPTDSGVPADDERIPYQCPFPADAASDIVIPDALTSDERLWVLQEPNVWIRPLCFSAAQGYYTSLLRVRRSGVLSRHRHPAPVHGFVLKGRWHYLEHDWVAEKGSYVYEPPGVTHTLVVPDDVEEMITFFHVTGGMIYVDPMGNQTGYADVFTRIEMCRSHFEAVGLGGDYVTRFVR